MSAYRCPSCGSTDPWLYVRCQRTGCPDGRDPRPLPVSDELVRHRAENERLVEKGFDLISERDAAKAENVRLISSVDEATDDRNRWQARAQAAEAECERLTKERDEWRASETEFKGLTEEWQAMAEAAKARADKAAEDMRERAVEIARTFEDWGDYGGYLETASVQIAKRIRALQSTGGQS